MAKKKETTKVKEPMVEETMVVEEPRVETPIEKAKPKNTWEIKERTYVLKSGQRPLSKSIKATDIYWFDEEKGYERELKYCENQRTVFVDEMKGDQRLSHIIFRAGVLHVPKEKVTLQKLLSLYHPQAEKTWTELKPKVRAANEVDMIELELAALNEAMNMDIDIAESIMRVEMGSKVSKLSSKELKRDLLLFAKRQPSLFLNLATDENIQLRNFGIKAVEAGIMRLSNDQRHFIWSSNDRKLMTIPFDEHPYSALAQWFKTDEGMEVYQNIEKRMK